MELNPNLNFSALFIRCRYFHHHIHVYVTHYHILSITMVVFACETSGSKLATKITPHADNSYQVRLIRTTVPPAQVTSDISGGV